jgi:hypothetical protein
MKTNTTYQRTEAPRDVICRGAAPLRPIRAEEPREPLATERFKL